MDVQHGNWSLITSMWIFGGPCIGRDEHTERLAGFKQGWPMETCWLYWLRRGVQCHEHNVQEQESIAACWPCASILVPRPDWLQDAICLFRNKPGKFSRLVSKCLGLNKLARWFGFQSNLYNIRRVLQKQGISADAFPWKPHSLQSCEFQPCRPWSKSGVSARHLSPNQGPQQYRQQWRWEISTHGK